MIKHIILACLLGLVAMSAASAKNDPLSNSQQLLLVTTPGWDQLQGTLQRYKRSPNHYSWIKEGNAMPVVVGQKGLALGVHPLNDHEFSTNLLKKEGDLRTPAGIFPVGVGFGFGAQPDIAFQLNYVPLKDTTVCVDDPASHYYNQLIDSAKISQPDWHSGEKMREIAAYEHGAVINYNMTPSVPNAGSCIFLHQWRSFDKGTAGCIAMAEADLKTVLTWLDPRKYPMIAIMPVTDLKKFNIVIPA